MKILALVQALMTPADNQKQRLDLKDHG